MASGIEALRRQHEQLLEALEELELTVEEEGRVRLLAHIGQRLKAHAAVEEEVFYRALEAAGGNTAAAVGEAIQAHQAIDMLLDEMIGSDIAAGKVRALAGLAREHFEREEALLFPAARRLAEPARGRLERAIDAYLEEYGDGAEDTLPA